MVYGGIDGTITSFAVVAGATGASLGSSIIIIVGLGTVIADGLSMAAASFFSKKSEKDLAEKNERENGEVYTSPGINKNPVITSLITFLSFIIIGTIPLLIYILSIFFNIDHLNLFLISAIGVAISLSIIGIIRGLITGKNLPRCLLETLFLGGLAASAAYYIGYFLQGLIQ